MLKLSLPFSLALISLSLSAYAAPQADQPVSTPAAAEANSPAPVKMDPMTPVVRVNGVVLPAVQLALLRAERKGRSIPSGQDPDEYLRDSLINAELMAQEAVKMGLDKPIGVQTAIEMSRKELLGRALVEDFVSKHPVSEERSKAEYDRIKAKAGDMEYHARHILVPEEKLAKEIVAKLGGKKPAKFETLAKKYSKDSSADNGGDLGWMAPSNLVPEFAQAMTKLNKGEYTKDPVKSKFGWHVIQLEDTRPIEFPAYDKVRARIDNQIIQNDIRQYVSELRAKAVVEIPTATPVAATAAPEATPEATTK